MVSTRQRKTKAIRKAREMAKAYMKEAFKKIAEGIRTDSFKSVFGVRNAVFGSAYSDKGTIKRDADIPGKVGTGLIASTARKDPYLECFPEDLEWASERLKKHGNSFSHGLQQAVLQPVPKKDSQGFDYLQRHRTDKYI